MSRCFSWHCARAQRMDGIYVMMDGWMRRRHLHACAGGGEPSRELNGGKKSDNNNNQRGARTDMWVGQPGATIASAGEPSRATNLDSALAPYCVVAFAPILLAHSASRILRQLSFLGAMRHLCAIYGWHMRQPTIFILARIGVGWHLRQLSFLLARTAGIWWVASARHPARARGQRALKRTKWGGGGGKKGEKKCV